MGCSAHAAAGSTIIAQFDHRLRSLYNLWFDRPCNADDSDGGEAQCTQKKVRIRIVELFVPEDYSTVSLCPLHSSGSVQ